MNIKETIQIVLEQLELNIFIFLFILIATGLIYILQYYHLFSKTKNYLSTLCKKINISFKRKLFNTKLWKKYTKMREEYQRIQKIKENQASREYFLLSPTDSVKESENFYAMDFALAKRNNQIHNIAITGPYGSGKSSFWETYKKIRYDDGLLPFKKKELLEISLAKFSERRENCSSINAGNQKRVLINNYNSNCIDEKEKEEYELERGILQQILFSVESDDIPKSKIKKIKDASKQILFAIALIGIFIYAYCLWFDCLWDKMHFSLNSFFKSDLISDSFTLIFLVLLSVIYILFVIFILRLYTKEEPIKLSKISYSGLEVSFDERKGSLINQNLTELIYFFEKTNKKIVVFEDIDRNKTSTIFAKLRELNRVLNNCPKLKNSIKFIYMVCDDILQKYERTKFFDFIIPVVPVLNGDNATSYIMKHFIREENDIFNEKPYLSPSYLEHIQKYIDDLRLIKNCFNELKIYKEVNPHFHGLQGDEKIFSLILYKNLYPKDFKNLLRQRGVLHYCLNNSSHDLLEELKKDNEEK